MRDLKKGTLIVTAAGLLAACGAGDSSSGDIDSAVVKSPEERVALKRVRMADPDSGRDLFVDKGCVICHSVNGAGGKAAPALDAPFGAPAVDPLDFAARMWRGAPAMIELQTVELGYSIDLTAYEIADLAAFAADRQAQKSLTADALPETVRAGLLDQRFWEMDDWEDFLRARREGFPDAPEGLEFEELPVDPD